MKALLIRLAQNPKVRQAFMALLLAVLAALGISGAAGCGSASVPPAVAARLAELECQRAALKSVVPAYVAEDLVMGVRARNYQYVVKQLLGLGLTPDAIRDLGRAIDACEGPSSAPDAGVPVQPSVERS